MLYYNRIDISEETDVAKSSNSKECIIYHYVFLIIDSDFKTLYTMVVMTLCSCHVTYAFQSESTLYSCLNVKERSRHEI